MTGDPQPLDLDTVPTGDWVPSGTWFPAGHVITIPASGWYRFNRGKPVLLSDEEVRAMGLEP